MAWVKRNLYFVISCVVAVALLGAAGWYCYSEWQGNATSWDQLNQAHTQLKTLGEKPVTPTKENIDAAHDQTKQAQELAKGLRKHLTPIDSIPNTNNVDDRVLAFAVRDTIRDLTASAADNRVGVPLDFAFSFSAQREKTVYATGSREHLARQLGEVNAICQVLFTNRVNSLESLLRERTADDTVSGTQPDYLDLVSVTNNNTIMSPYQVTFLCFDQELAEVLDGFANQPHGIMVRSLEVVPADMTPAEGGMQQPAYQPPYTRMGGGGEGGGIGTMAPSVLGMKGGLPIVVDEKKLRVTMLLELVRIIPTPGR